MNPTIRADHVGSLLRPKPLLEARRARDEGRITDDQLRQEEDAAISRVLELQREAGIEVFTDGEFRRLSWLSGLPDVLDGVRSTGLRRMPANAWKGVGAEAANAEVPIAALQVTARLKPKRRFTGGEAAFLKANAPGPWKITMPSPTIQMNMFDPGSFEAVYSDRQALLGDIVAIYQDEVEALAAEGAGYIQLDSLRYSQAIAGFSPNGFPMGDPNEVVSQTIAADNTVLRRAKAGGAVTGVHICRGNHRSAWVMSGGYDSVAERLFNEVETDRFLLEYDDDRSGGFEPLRFLPKDKIVVLGLVTSKLGALEDSDALMRRVDEAAKYAPVEQLALSPQCGFASTYLGNLLTEDDQKRKLALVADTARRIWG
jgi:5-methyltetrahydropteroyltriglutamate--homocysteine methyltransferase